MRAEFVRLYATKAPFIALRRWACRSGGLDGSQRVRRLATRCVETDL